MNQRMQIAQQDKCQTEPPSLKVGVVCSSLNLAAWQMHALRLLTSKRAGSVEIIIETQRPLSTSKHSSVPLPFLLRKLKSHKFCPALRTTPILEEFPKVPVQHCGLQQETNQSFQIAPVDLEKIRALNLDFILDFTSLKFSGDILSVAKYGLWHFGKADGSNDKDYLSLFWAVFDKKPLTTAALYKSAKAPNNPDELLRTGSFRTCNSFAKNLSQVLSITQEWPTSMANQIRYDHYSTIQSNLFDNNQQKKAGTRPTSGQLGRYILSQARHIATKIANKFFFYTIWEVGIAKISFDQLLQNGLPEKMDWAPGFGLNYFIADPIALDHGHRLDVFVEDYVFTRGTGTISSIGYDKHVGWSNDKIQVIAEKFHMSYPFIVHTPENTYCFPETNKAGDLYCYKIDPDRLQVLSKQTFMENFPIVDPTFFFHAGKWWLFGDISGLNSRFTLRLWYADELFGAWTEHPLNPVICDIATARPAGPIISHNGRLYRPAQNSTSQYGEAISLLEITKLSPTQYEEKMVMDVRPHPSWPQSDGLHTLGVTSQGIVIDSKAKRLSFLSVFYNIYHPIKRSLRLLSKSS